MSIYGKILFDHENFQDLITPSDNSHTRHHVANLFLENGPIANEFNKKVDKIDDHRLITPEEINKLADLEKYVNSQIKAESDQIYSNITNTEENLNNQLDNLNSSINTVAQDLCDLIGTVDKKDELMTIIQSLKNQLTEDGLVLLMARVQQLENLLYTDNLIIGEVDNSSVGPIGNDITHLIYDGGMVYEEGIEEPGDYVDPSVEDEPNEEEDFIEEQEEIE